MLLEKRLDIKNVYGSAGDLPLAERVDKGRLLNDGSSSCIHEPG
jgi:hypothetical protein